MWHDRIGEKMSPHVSVGVWGLRCSQTKTKTSAVRCKDCLNVVFLNCGVCFTVTYGLWGTSQGQCHGVLVD